MGVGLSKEELEGWADALNCEVESIPFVYLGLPIGVRPSERKIWEKVMVKVQQRLNSWGKQLSFLGW